MTDETTARAVLEEALRVEDLVHRDAVLARHPLQAPAVRNMMQGIALRLSNWVRHAGTGVKVWTGRMSRPMNPDERRALRNERLAAIEPEWLRERVRVMVEEQFAKINRRRREMREAMERL